MLGNNPGFSFRKLELADRNAIGQLSPIGATPIAALFLGTSSSRVPSAWPRASPLLSRQVTQRRLSSVASASGRFGRTLWFSNVFSHLASETSLRSLQTLPTAPAGLCVRFVDQRPETIAWASGSS